MATLETSAAQMSTPSQQNHELAIHVQALQQRADTAEAALAQAQSRTSSAYSNPVPAIDTRIIGKPDTFDGHKGWKDWSIVLKSYAGAINPNLQLLMEQAAQAASPMLNATLSHDQAQLSAQLYYILVMVCKSTALTRVVNAGPSEGLEAWRTLVHHHEPASATRHAGLLLELLSFSFEGDIQERLELFDRDVHRYEQSSNETLSSGIRVGIVLRQLPEGALKQHLLMNAHKFETWETLRNEIADVRRAQAAAQAGPSPMSVDALAKQLADQIAVLSLKGKGKGKGSGKSDSKRESSTRKGGMPCPQHQISHAPFAAKCIGSQNVG